MLNAQSAKLALNLDAQAGAQSTVSTKEMAKYATKLATAKSAKARPSVIQRTKDVFSWLGGAVMKAAKVTTPKALLAKGLQAAGNLGVNLPFDKDIARLGDMKSELSSLKFQMDDIINKGVARLLSRKEASTDVKARNLQTSASQAKAQLISALSALDAAQSAAQQGKNLISQGRLPAEATAVFAVKKNQADSLYKSAKARAEGVRASWQDIESGLVTADKPTVRSYAQAAGQTGGEFASRAGGALTSFGEGAESAIKEVAAGAKAATPLLKYWPVALVVIGGAYVYSQLPKSSQKPQ